MEWLIIDNPNECLPLSFSKIYQISMPDNAKTLSLYFALRHAANIANFVEFQPYLIWTQLSFFYLFPGLNYTVQAEEIKKREQRVITKKRN